MRYVHTVIKQDANLRSIKKVTESVDKILGATIVFLDTSSQSSHKSSILVTQ
jgi:hypothetical protein